MSDWLEELDRLERETPKWERHKQSKGDLSWDELTLFGTALAFGIALRNHARELIDAARIKDRADKAFGLDVATYNNAIANMQKAHAYDRKAAEERKAELLAENTKLRKLLSLCEWISIQEGEYCLFCMEWQKHGHRDGCELAEALK